MPLFVFIERDESLNSAPYFDEQDWSLSEVIELEKGNSQDFFLPAPFDDDDDEVSVEVDTESIYQYATWDSSSMVLSLDATDSIESGLYRATVTLDDGELTTEYTLSILILEPEVPDPPETEETE